MALRGIDVASWQKGLNVSEIDADFIIVKATQGTGYVNPYCAQWVEGALGRGMCVGIYHYISGGNASGEMAHFWQSCKTWNNRVIWCLDWEGEQNSAWGNDAYLAICIDEITRLTGKPPIVYASASVYPYKVVDARNCGRWMAQYANMSSTGYQDKPWNEGAYTCAIRQYSSTGNIAGYSGALDLNKFYGDRATWMRYANPQGATPTPTPSPEPEKENDMTDAQAAQLTEIRNEVMRRDDVSGREMAVTTHEQINYMAAKQAQMYAAMKKICSKLEIEFGGED